MKNGALRPSLTLKLEDLTPTSNHMHPQRPLATAQLPGSCHLVSSQISDRGQKTTDELSSSELNWPPLPDPFLRPTAEARVTRLGIAKRARVQGARQHRSFAVHLILCPNEYCVPPMGVAFRTVGVTPSETDHCGKQLTVLSASNSILGDLGSIVWYCAARHLSIPG